MRELPFVYHGPVIINKTAQNRNHRKTPHVMEEPKAILKVSTNSSVKSIGNAVAKAGKQNYDPSLPDLVELSLNKS